MKLTDVVGEYVGSGVGGMVGDAVGTWVTYYTSRESGSQTRISNSVQTIIEYETHKRRRRKRW